VCQWATVNPVRLTLTPRESTLPPSRFWSAVIPAAFAALALTACSSSHATATGPTPTPTRVSTPGRSPTPKASATRRAKPTPSPSSSVFRPSKLPRATGTGPSGSMLVTGNSTVALTFDDGPDPTYTPKILDLLKRYGIKATFCVVGFRARDNPSLIKRIVAEGHTLCNHSWQHLMDLDTRSDSDIINDLKATNNAIHKAVPKARIRYFRAPGGNYNTRLVALAASLGMKSLYWTVDPRDWEFTVYGHGSTMVSHIIAAVKAYTRPGAIVLSHDLNKPDTITAYATLLPWLKGRFVLVALPT
jgi:peptidoglycan-N-acetylglucosamine deacetylase